jgi:hypothetical protein
MPENLSKDRFKRDFYYALRESDFESGYLSSADRYLEQSIEKEGQECFKWIYELYRDKYNDEYIITQLLGALSHVPSKVITPECVAIVTESLQRENSCAIIEKAVMIFENWEFTPGIPLLETVHLKNTNSDELWAAEWIDKYIKDVIYDLKEILRVSFINGKCMPNL